MVGVHMSLMDGEECLHNYLSFRKQKTINRQCLQTTEVIKSVLEDNMTTLMVVQERE